MELLDDAVRYGDDERIGGAVVPRQKEVLSHLAQGKSNKVIASSLGCAEVTLELHVTAILAKLGCKSRAEAIARFWTA